MRPCYLGPLVVMSRNRGGAYILCKLDGMLAHSPFAVFHVIPYFARDHIDIPNLEDHINVTVVRLQEMEDSAEVSKDSNNHAQSDAQPDEEDSDRED